LQSITRFNDHPINYPITQLPNYQMYFVLEYQVVDHYAERRTPFRAEHLRHLQAAKDRGEVVMAGATGDPPSGALLVFTSESAAAAESFARNDPYVREGLITRWTVKPWHLV
jgi:hypothetical protein